MKICTIGLSLWITIFVGKPNRYLMNNALNEKASWGMLEHQYEYAYNAISGNYLFHFAFLNFKLLKF